MCEGLYDHRISSHVSYFNIFNALSKPELCWGNDAVLQQVFLSRVFAETSLNEGESSEARVCMRVLSTLVSWSNEREQEKLHEN